MFGKSPLRVVFIFCLAACAQIQPDAQMNVAGNRYLSCLDAAAETNITNPAGAEEIANAAHARCWSEWQAYREATKATYTAGAGTPEDMQFANDKADAQLRQFEIEARRAVVSRVVERSYGVSKPAP